MLIFIFYFLKNKIIERVIIQNTKSKKSKKYKKYVCSNVKFPRDFSKNFLVFSWNFFDLLNFIKFCQFTYLHLHI